MTKIKHGTGGRSPLIVGGLDLTSPGAESSNGEGRLKIAPVESGPDPEYFWARLFLEDLTATVSFYELRGFVLG